MVGLLALFAYPVDVALSTFIPSVYVTLDVVFGLSRVAMETPAEISLDELYKAIKPTVADPKLVPATVPLNIVKKTSELVPFCAAAPIVITKILFVALDGVIDPDSPVVTKLVEVVLVVVE